MYATKVTKFRKVKGSLLYPYDVYIGPELKNSNWDLQESVWSNPYQFGKTCKVKDKLQRYKREVIDKKGPKVFAMLRQLHGKTLGCMCPNIRNCHGHLLAKLVQGEAKLTNVFDEASLSIEMGPIVFFKGEKCPLSNCYFNTAHPIMVSHEEDFVFPFGVWQASSALKSRDLKWDRNEWSITEAKNIRVLNSTLSYFDFKSKSLGPSIPWDLQKSLQIMLKLIKAKCATDPVFISYCDKLGNKVPCEATGNKYWGCSVDIEVLCSLDPNLVKTTVDGRNTLGWLIKIACTECTLLSDCSWVWEVLNDDFFPNSMKDGLCDVCKCINITECGLLEAGKVSWEEEENIKTPLPKHGASQNETGERGGREVVGKTSELEQDDEKNDTLPCA